MLVKDTNDMPFLQSNRAMDKAQEIANKILKSTPHLANRIVFLVKNSHPFRSSK